MKKNLIFTLLSTIFLLSSCSTDFELEAEWKDIPIVYSFLSVQDTAHYVRVEKAFLEPGGNAFEIAQVTDSIYYQNLTVELENITTGETFIMEKVDGADEGYPKEEGLFANDPNVLYKLRGDVAVLGEGDSVRLTLYRGDNVEPAIAKIQMAGKIISNMFRPPDRITRTRFNVPLDIAWTPDENTRIFDLRFNFNYQERLPGASGFTPKTATWVVSRSVTSPDNNNGDVIIYQAGWENFYQALATQIPEVEGAERVFSSMDLYITGAGEELYQFVRVSRANTGITSAQSTPTYSNVEGGLGIVTSRYTTVRPGIVLAEEALDSLKNGIYTRDLNFN
ncbi:MAG: DUF4249 family protein [Lewinellaceae bacterium]|nr:DUF4249 family protein [Lewinellaceae bacterium]